MRQIIIALFLSFLLLFSNATANTYVSQTAGPQFPTNLPAMNSLLNPNAFTISHQVNYAYIAGGHHTSQMTGMYVSTINYQLNGPLSVKLHLGYKYQPEEFSTLSSDQGMLSGVTLLYNVGELHQFGLEYGLSDKNSFMYNYVNHDTKPFNLWYEGSFFNNNLQVNVNVSNQPGLYYNNRPWFMR